MINTVKVLLHSMKNWMFLKCISIKTMNVLCCATPQKISMLYSVPHTSQNWIQSGANPFSPLWRPHWVTFNAFPSFNGCTICASTFKHISVILLTNMPWSSRLGLSIMINGHLSKQATLYFWKTNVCLSNHNVNNEVTATRTSQFKI